jgi:ubiquinone/menaquinone biosynthesis C-methylase UbiE
MSDQSPELLEKIRQQFDFGPYPRIPIETSPTGDYNSLFIHNALTAFYVRDQRIVESRDLTILDVGCGTGYKTLTLAKANPGARIVGVDLSPKSIELAQKRLEFHNIENFECHVLDLEQLPELGLKFDYINCDELLYLFPDIATALAAMGQVLKPDGIIRSNLHSALQRATYFRAQELFGFMGLMDGNPEEFEIQCVIDMIKALKDGVEIKGKVVLKEGDFDKPEVAEGILMNYLFQGDKGYRIGDLFDGLRSANLEFISMVDWRQWELLDLFKSDDAIPAVLAMGLEDADMETRLHLYELMNPVKRLLDFWCGHPVDQEESPTPLALWKAAQWSQARVRLHPQLMVEAVKNDLMEAIRSRSRFEISRYISTSVTAPISLDPGVATCLLPLWEGEQSIHVLADRLWRSQPVDLVTLEPIDQAAAFGGVKSLLQSLEIPLYVLLRSDG